MTQPATTLLHLDPTMDQWRPVPRNVRTAPLIATGHQPTLWHPGILAKYLAADAVAKRVGAGVINVVVEHNPIGPLSIDVPMQQGERLSVRHILLDDRAEALTLPPNRLNPLDFDRVIDHISDAAATASDEVIEEGVRPPLGLLSKAYYASGAYASSEAHTSLASQTSDILNRLMRRYLSDPMPALPTSELVTNGFIDRLLADPLGSVRCYNRAALAYPEAGIRPLYAGRDVVEVPLWAQDATTCTPVYIDIGDSRRAFLFTTQHNRHLDLTATNAVKYLRPRAITLSAIMRSEHCDLFIHGKGGCVYDQVTERWWRDWTGEDLAPKAVVSADVYLPFDVPTAIRQQRDRALWFEHHLPFNVDRFEAARDEAEAELQREKRQLLDRMNDDRDKRRRARAFKRIHAINAELRDRHRARLDEAHAQAERTRQGVANHAIAMRRDWCFALYPEDVLQGLAEQITQCLASSPR